MKFAIVFLVSVLILGSSYSLQNDNWSKEDEQSKTQSKNFYQAEDETFKLDQLDNSRSGDETDRSRPSSYSNFESEELGREAEVLHDARNSLPMDSAKAARLSMDNMVRKMRSKEVAKAYQQLDGQQPTAFEQSIEPRGPEHDDDKNDPNIRIAVQSKRRYEFVPVHFDRDDRKMPRMIEIVSDTMPLRLHFKSQSAAIVVTQSHMSPPVKPVDESVTMDQPYRLNMEVHKPIIQNLKEYIQPYKNVIQTIRPVIEDIKTIVPKDSDILHQHQQSSKPSFGGISGSVKPTDWNPLVMPRRSSLKVPPPRPPSPGQQISGKFNSRPPYDSVKGSESQARIQRRMQQDEHSFRRSARHTARRGPPMGQMQFGSSELVYVPMMPNEMQSRGANKDSQRLGDYLANKNRFHYNPEGYSNGAHHEYTHQDRDMAESGRYESINANNYLHQSDEYFTGEHLGATVETEDFASEAADEMSPQPEENFSPMERCSALGRCPAHMWSDSFSF